MFSSLETDFATTFGFPQAGTYKLPSSREKMFLIPIPSFSPFFQLPQAVPKTYLIFEGTTPHLILRLHCLQFQGWLPRKLLADKLFNKYVICFGLAACYSRAFFVNLFAVSAADVKMFETSANTRWDKQRNTKCRQANQRLPSSLFSNVPSCGLFTVLFAASAVNCK